MNQTNWQGNFCLCRRPGDDPKHFMVKESLSFTDREEGLTIMVLPGLVTDGASVPRALWWYAAPFAGKHGPAALIHDGLYATHLLARKTADDIFYHAMLDLGVRQTKAWAMYQSVRAFGGVPWNEKNPSLHLLSLRYVKVS